MEASEAAQAPAEQQATEQQSTETQTSGATPSVGDEGQSALEQRVAALEKPAEPEAQTGITDPLLDYLGQFGDEENGLEGEQELGYDEQMLAEPDQGLQFNSQEELDAYVQQKAAEVLQPYALQQELGKRRGDLDALDEKYDGGITKHAEELRPVLHAIAEEYGNEYLATDPRLVEQAYKSLMADEASAAETPAEQAANAGASLETGTGPGSQGQSEDPDEAIKSSLLQTAGGTDPFTS